MMAAGRGGDNGYVKFAVISDPHAFAGEEDRDGTHTRLETADDPERNPFAAVRALIEESRQAGEETLAADVLLCPGDLAHRMNEEGLRYAWRELGAIAKLLGTERIVATAGNHDVMRHEDLPPNQPPGAWVSALRDLQPHFPTLGREESQRYFGDHFVIIEGGQWRVVTLNSCAKHCEPYQAWHGKIDQATLDHLATEIARRREANRKLINIFMCHHHPVEWPHLTQDDTSYMQNGERLVRTLETDDPGRWLVLHGHRHFPALGYAGETASGPVRLSAGSLGSTRLPQARAGVLNQFYMLEFKLEELAYLGLDGAGRFRAWDWHMGAGFVAANPEADLPPEGGFGFRRTAPELARDCEKAARSRGQRSVTIGELVHDDGRWAYLIPRDLLMLREVLEEEGALVQPLEGGSLIQRVSFRGDGSRP